MHPWSELKWWDCGERQAAEEKIDDLQGKGVTCNPQKHNLYKALSLTKEEDCKVCIIGQDPYPNKAFSTGVAFSIPREIEREDFPQTLRIVLGEYSSDLGYEVPSHGDLTRWASQGVLLWNAIPSVQHGSPLSNDWCEWSYLTREIVERLSQRGIVFALLGTVARRFEEFIPTERNRVVITSHPSPRGNRFGKSPFTGSRVFTTINAKLRELNKTPIDWDLEPKPKKVIPEANVLPNINRYPLGGLPKPRLPKRLESTFVLENSDGEIEEGGRTSPSH